MPTEGQIHSLPKVLIFHSADTSFMGCYSTEGLGGSEPAQHVTVTWVLHVTP